MFKRVLFATSLVATIMVAVPFTAGASVRVDETRNIARDAYVFGTPMVDTYRVMYAFSIDKSNPQYKGPFNSILNVSRVFTPADTAFVTPNSDTPYSFVGLDLRAEPVIISVPPMEKNRYFVFQLMDLYSFNFSYIGSRTTGNQGGTYMIAGPDWKGEKPKGVDKVIQAETEMVSVVGRTQLFNPDDLENVKKIQDNYKVQTLSAFQNKPAPKAAPEVNWIKPIAPAVERSSPEFFNQLAFLLQFAPTHPSEVALRKRFTEIGIQPGQPFDVSKLSQEEQAALVAGMKDGQQEIDRLRNSLGGKTDTLFGTREYLKNNYVMRATGTQMGIGANSREEAMYPIYDKDATGQPLDGSQHKYTLRFAKGEQPPVQAFWSLTMYDLPKQLLVDNPINRYLINSPMLPNLAKDADGGLTLYIQHESPGKNKEANWLPAPNGPFMVTMRYYWPKPELLSGKWHSPQINRAK
ncbi:DUF1254 domain-containing protein [Pseudomonas moraviensis]|uniref:Cell envelope protein n=1 Tax=Pseudomonas moraviensis TaxID=321662 RepID=A0A7Y9W0X4_9PSED|nr:DUF1254 domain-containing protein [Pseudomonas moraviensis]NYH11671.1 hypothetical protein [Pseudomonas moraviensis]